MHYILFIDEQQIVIENNNYVFSSIDLYSSHLIYYYIHGYLFVIAKV